MPIRKIGRRLAAPGLAGLVSLLAAACSGPPDPYARVKNPPLVQARLHAVTLAVSDASALEQLHAEGYREIALPPNYPPAIAVEANIWQVAEPVAAGAVILQKPAAVDVRVLTMKPLPERAAPASDGHESFFRNVLGTEPPRWPAQDGAQANARVQVWTYLVPSVVEARQRLRENNIPVVFDAVAILTPYLGDHKVLALRAPDGVTVELVETTAQ